jgi:hypothetical protein
MYYVIYRGRVHNSNGRYWVEVGVSTSLKHVLDQADEHGRVDYSEHHTLEEAESTWRAYCAAQRWYQGAGMDKVAALKYRQVSEGTVHIDGRHLTRKDDTSSTLF